MGSGASSSNNSNSITKVLSSNKMISMARKQTISGEASNNSSSNTVRDKTRNRNGAREKTIRVLLNSTIKKIAELQTVSSKAPGKTKTGETSPGVAAGKVEREK